MIDRIATIKPLIDNRTSFLPRHFPNTLLKIPTLYKIHTSAVLISLASKKEKSGNAMGSQIIPIIKAMVKVVNPITAE
jgi:hypothetical protein